MRHAPGLRRPFTLAQSCKSASAGEIANTCLQRLARSATWAVSGRHSGQDLPGSSQEGPELPRVLVILSTHARRHASCSAFEPMNSHVGTAMLVSLLAMSSACDLFEPKTSECGPAKKIDVDAPLPGLQTTGSNLTAKLALPLRFDVDYAKGAHFASEVVTVTFDDDGRIFKVPWDITTDGVCFPLDPTKKVGLRVHSASGLLDEEGTAQLSITNEGLVATLSSSELDGGAQDYVRTLKLKKNASTEWTLKIRFESDGTPYALSLDLSLTRHADGGIYDDGQMNVANGSPH
jgi:hypothetical protein